MERFGIFIKIVRVSYLHILAEEVFTDSSLPRVVINRRLAAIEAPLIVKL